jgi:hypothetical protein
MGCAFRLNVASRPVPPGSVGRPPRLPDETRRCDVAQCDYWVVQVDVAPAHVAASPRPKPRSAISQTFPAVDHFPCRNVSVARRSTPRPGAVQQVGQFLGQIDLMGPAYRFHARAFSSVDLPGMFLTTPAGYFCHPLFGV